MYIIAEHSGHTDDYNCVQFSARCRVVRECLFGLRVSSAPSTCTKVDKQYMSLTRYSKLCSSTTVRKTIPVLQSQVDLHFLPCHVRIRELDMRNGRLVCDAYCGTGYCWSWSSGALLWSVSYCIQYGSLATASK